MFGLLLMPQHMLQLKDDTARCEEDEAEKKIKLKAMREHHHKWEDTREGHVAQRPKHMYLKYSINVTFRFSQCDKPL